MIDIYHSRRGMYKKCVYWGRCEDGVLDKFAIDNEPLGIFYAKETSTPTENDRQINSSIQYSENQTTLFTNDEIDIKPDYIVKYAGNLWRVSNIQKKLHIKESEFSSTQHYSTYINLIR